MSSQPIKTPSRRRLLLVGIVALVARRRHRRRRPHRAGLAASRTLVAVDERTRRSRPSRSPSSQHGDAEQNLTLPGTIQPYNKAAIYARVNGYLKSWKQDIGAQVKAGRGAGLDRHAGSRPAARAGQGRLWRPPRPTTTWRRSPPSAGRRCAHAGPCRSRRADESAADAAAKKAVIGCRRRRMCDSWRRWNPSSSIVAPFDGVVTARNTDVGALINAGSSCRAGAVRGVRPAPGPHLRPGAAGVLGRAPCRV